MNRTCDQYGSLSKIGTTRKSSKTHKAERKVGEFKTNKLYCKHKKQG